MIHYTLNTSHARHSPRSEVGDEVIERMHPLTEPGEHSLADFGPAFSPYRLAVPVAEGGFVASLYRGDTPLFTMGVAATPFDASVVWPSLEQLYLTITDMPGMRSADFAAPSMPAGLPWLAVALVMPLALPDWAGDFERCLAWAWLEASS